MSRIIKKTTKKVPAKAAAAVSGGSGNGNLPRNGKPGRPRTREDNKSIWRLVIDPSNIEAVDALQESKQIISRTAYINDLIAKDVARRSKGRDTTPLEMLGTGLIKRFGPAVETLKQNKEYEDNKPVMQAALAMLGETIKDLHRALEHKTA